MGRPGRLRRIALWLTAGVGMTLAAILLFLFFLPSFLSTQTARSLIVGHASKALNRPVRVSGLSWSWGKGIQVEGLSIDDAPEFSPRPWVSIDRVRFQLSFRELLSRRVVFQLYGEGLDARMIRNADGKTNWGAFLAGLPPGKPSPPREGPTAIPVDVSGQVRLGRLNLTAEDRAQGRRVAFRDASLAVDIPSLRRGVSTLRFSSAVEADGRELPQVSFAADVEGLFDSQGVLDPKRLKASVKADLPGVRFGLTAHMAKTAVEGRLGIDLAQILPLVLPFVPPSVAPREAGGLIELNAVASGDPAKTVSFDLSATGSDLRAAGGALKRGPFGPVRFAVSNRGRFDAPTRSLSVDAGELRLQERCKAAWKVPSLRVEGKARSGVAQVGPVSLDLAELLGVARPFLLEPLPVSFGSESRARPVLEVSGAQVSGELPAGPYQVTVKGVRLQLPALAVQRAEGAGSVRGLRLDVASLEAALERFFPTRLSLAGRLRLDALNVGGSTRASGERFDLSSLEVKGEELRRPAGGGVPASGRVTVHASLAAGALALDKILEVKDAAERLEAQLVLKADGGRELQLQRLDLSAVAARFQRGGADGGLSLSLERRRGAKSISLSVRSARFAQPKGTGPRPLSVGEVVLYVPGLHLERPGNDISLAGLDLRLRDGVAVLRGSVPESAGFSGALDLDSLRLAGERQVSLDGLRIGPLQLSASGVARAPAAVLGLKGRVALRQGLSLRSCRVAGLAEIQGLTQAFDGEVSLGEAGELKAAGLRLSAASLRLEDARGGPPVLLPLLRLEASADEARLRRMRPLQADAAGVRASLGAGDFAETQLALAAKSLGQEALSTSGRLRLDLTRLPRALLTMAAPKARAGGEVRMSWDVAGRTPRPGELQALRDQPSSVPFVEKVDLSLALHDLLVHMPLGNGRLRLAGVETPSPIRVGLGRGAAKGSLEGRVLAKVVEELPSLGPFDVPPRAELAVFVSQESLKSLKVSERFEVEPLRLRQTLEADVTGLDRLSAWRAKPEWPLLLNLLGGKVAARLDAGRGAGAIAAGENLRWNGPLGVELEARLIPGQSVSSRIRAESSGVDAKLGRLLQLNGFQANLDLGKSYRLARAPQSDRGRRPPEALPLSRAVLEPGGRSGSAEATRSSTSLRGLPADIGPQFRGRPTMAFRLAEVTAGGLRLNLAKSALDLRLEKGLPVVERVQMDLLGGTVVGSAEIAKGAGQFPLQMRASFSGLNGKKLLPDTMTAMNDQEAEIGGQLAMAVPISTKAAKIMEEAEVQIELTRIGPKALDRFLYGLDPSGSNEALVQQRRLLRTGTPRWVRLALRRGNLSLNGEVEVKGLRLSLPPIEQVNVADLPGRDKLERALMRLGPALEAMRKASADTLEVGDDGRLRFVSAKE